MKKQIIVTPAAPKAIGPYSQATCANGFLFISGQLGIRPETGDFAGASVEEQAEQAFRNLEAILAAAGTNSGNVMKTTVFLSDMNDFPAVNAIYAQFFREPYPARACVQVARLPKDAKVEIEAVALS
jgi:2-iminobutanoate/2-iminopropanoate deaminase